MLRKNNKQDATPIGSRKHVADHRNQSTRRKHGAILHKFLRCSPLQAVFLLLLTAALLMLTGRFYDVTAKPQQRPQAHYAILIDVNDKRLYLLKNGVLFKSYRCAVGAKDSPSPLGGFTIVRKSRWGEGFGGSWMGINCPWGNYGIHGTRRPDTIGTAASHGCFRMYSSECDELYRIVPVGTPVVVTGGSYGPFGNGYRTIQPGMYGADVQTVQNRLAELGFYKGSCNGRYDAAGFRGAIHRFQKAYGLIVSDSLTRKAAEKMGFVFMD